MRPAPPSARRRHRALDHRFGRNTMPRRAPLYHRNRTGLGYHAAYDTGSSTRIRRYRSHSSDVSERSVATAPKRTQLREACRAQDRTNPVFIRCLDAIVQNVVYTGATVLPTTADAEWNRQAAALYRARCGREHFQPDRMRHEIEAYKLVVRSHHRDGGVLVYRPLGHVQLYEDGQIVTPSDQTHNAAVIDGFRFGGDGAIEGVYVGPYDRFGRVDSSRGSTTLLPAWHFDAEWQVSLPVCSYIRNQDFVSGLRGVPEMTGGLDHLERFDDYLEAILERAVNEACIMGALYSDDHDANAALSANRTDDDGTDTASETWDKISHIEPAIVPHLKTGEKLELLTPGTPSNNFQPFVHTLLKLVGLQVSLPIELSFLHFSDTNFSASRAAIEQAKRLWVMLQDLYAREWTGPNYLWTVYEAMRYDGTLPYRDDWRAHQVRPAGWKYLEPWTDARANAQRLNSGESNLTRILAEQGIGMEEHLRTTADEVLAAKRIAAETGVDPEILLKHAYGRAAAPSPVDGGRDSTGATP